MILFFNKTNNGTRPLTVQAEEFIIKKLINNESVTINGKVYRYLNLKIRENNISIFLAEIDS